MSQRICSRQLLQFQLSKPKLLLIFRKVTCGRSISLVGHAWGPPRGFRMLLTLSFVILLRGNW
uniref:AKH1 n=1 Tax=Arundo donax TaxID=35708 RepID=A0A0A9F9R8_ARUDO